MHFEHLQPNIRHYFKKSFKSNKENIFHSGTCSDVLKITTEIGFITENVFKMKTAMELDK